jgi:type 1 glutamine amidotransferase
MAIVAHLSLLRSLAAAAGAILVAGFTTPASAARPIDCPLRDQSYSLDSPLIDILIKPEAKAVFDRNAPPTLRSLPAWIQGTTPPTFASILSLRALVGGKGMTDTALRTLDRDLRALPVTPADKEQRCARYDVDQPKLVAAPGKPRFLLFEKITGFRDGPSVDAAHTALLALATRNGWTIVTTDKGGAITPALLRRFDAVIWNNVSGDVLTLGQRKAFKSYIEGGGGFVGIHGSGGDPSYFWDWYADTLIGARFLGHPMGPQFQDARVRVEDGASAVTRGLPREWTMKDEWYSFKTNPRTNGAHVLATLDESTYSPVEGAVNLRMGDDHPIAWIRCITNGRSFYSAIGHRPETYSEPHNVTLLEQGLRWAAGAGASRCRAGKEVVAP